jgi:membrane peptidoglycan carboxypeptidase
MGYTNGRQPLVNIKGLPQVFGGTLPAQTWHDFMTAALADLPVEDFTAPLPPLGPTTTATSGRQPGSPPGATTTRPITSTTRPLTTTTLFNVPPAPTTTTAP